MPLVISDFNIGLLFGGITLAEENLDLVAGGCEGILETGLVLDPARLILGRQHDTNLQLGSRS